MKFKGSPPSNSIIIANLSPIFFHPSLQAVLRSHFNTYGHIRSWTILPDSFKIHVVYSDLNCAQSAKEEMNEIVFEDFEIKELVFSLLDAAPLLQDGKEKDAILRNGNTKTFIKVYFAAPIPMSITSSSIQSVNEIETDNQEELKESIPIQSSYDDLLKPPNFDKNFLISPPGSPPVGWEQIEEEAPNQKDLADDLSQRLRFLSVNHDNEGEIVNVVNNNLSNSSHQSLLLDKEILLVPATPDSSLPSLKVHQIRSTRPSPGINIHLVKATIDSLKYCSTSSSTTTKISPTPMPQL